jgi:peptidoglycan/xylan/chitin deacetylase (PgdA/CDA1 family)
MAELGLGELEQQRAELEKSPTVIPILLFHSVSNNPSRYACRLAVTVDKFQKQLDLIVESGRTALNVSALVEALRNGVSLPERPIVITFDDGYSDFSEVVVDALHDRGLTATLYVTTGFLSGRPKIAAPLPSEDRMLSWSDLPRISSYGVEIGAHSHSHPELDVLSNENAWREISECKHLLEAELGEPVRSFAYPHGYFSQTVRQLVHEAGYDSACSVRNALSSSNDDPYSLARLTVEADTSLERFGSWIEGSGARKVSATESPATSLWRLYRRARAFSRLSTSR